MDGGPGTVDDLLVALVLLPCAGDLVESGGDCAAGVGLGLGVVAYAAGKVLESDGQGAFPERTDEDVLAPPVDEVELREGEGGVQGRGKNRRREKGEEGKE